jgi:Uma2 family endonuclease
MRVLDIAPAEGRKIYRKEYDLLTEAGCFENERIELLFGRMVERSPIGRQHNYSVMQLTELLASVLRGRAKVRVQSSFAALDDTEPEPDVAIVPVGDYLDDHPKIAFLIIEVAESSLLRDRTTKKLAYEAAGVPEYWIVNLEDNIVEAYRSLQNGVYTEVRMYRRNEKIPVPSFSDIVLDTGEFLPPA